MRVYDEIKAKVKSFISVIDYYVQTPEGLSLRQRTDVIIITIFVKRTIYHTSVADNLGFIGDINSLTNSGL